MAYTDFSLEDVRSGEDYLRHQTFAEVKYELQKKLLESEVIVAMKKAYAEIVENGVEEFSDYQSAKVVGPTNKAREAIYKKIPAFSDILGCVNPSEIEDVGISFYANAGGKAGLYLICDIKGLRDVTYRYTYPKPIEEVDPSTGDDNSSVNFTFRTSGCAVTRIENYHETGDTDVVDYPAAETSSTWSNVVRKGSYIVYRVVPDLNYSFTNMLVDDNLYTNIKALNDVPGITVAETSDGYEIVITHTAVDHTFVFTCGYDSTIITHNIVAHASRCTGTLFKDEMQLPFTLPGDNIILCTHGDKFDAYFTPAICTKIDSIIIDGRDYADEYTEGKMFEYKGRTADAMEFSITIGTDSSVSITMPSVCMDHEITVNYVNEQYNVKGYLVSPSGMQLEKVIDCRMSYEDSYESTVVYQYLNLGEYKDYQYSSIIVRDTDGKVLTANDIDVTYYDTSGRITIKNVKCDAVISIVLTEKPKTCIITGECVHCGVKYMASDEDVYATSVTTEPILYGGSAVFRIVANSTYRFTEDKPTFGANILIDGEEVDVAKIGANNIELVRINENAIMIGFALLNGDHTFRVEMTDDNLRPAHNVTFTGTRVVNNALSSEDDPVESYTGAVVEGGSITRVYTPVEGYAFPEEITTDDVIIKINGIALSAFSVIPSVAWNTNVAVDTRDGKITIALSEVMANSTVEVILDEKHKIPVYYNVGITTDNCFVEEDTSFSRSILEGNNFTFDITAIEGKEIPLNDDNEVDLNCFDIVINNQTITADNWPVNLEGRLIRDGGILEFTLNEVDKDYTISIGINYPEVPVTPTHSVTVVATNATVRGDNPITVEEGGDATIIIDANEGTSFENVMFILDKGTENQARWVIDMNTDSFNIFDREVEGVPQIDNDGTVVRTRDSDHYVYTVNLKDIQNDYEIRFSTVTIGV